jgi:hypothetical protein
MYSFIAFVVLVFSMSEAPRMRETQPAQPDANAMTLNGTASSVSDIDRFQEAAVYSGTGCSNCLRTNSTSSAR